MGAGLGLGADMHVAGKAQGRLHELRARAWAMQMRASWCGGE